MTQPTTFVVNLDRSPDRLAYMRRQGVAFERIAGVDGAGMVPAWLKNQFDGSPLTSGEIGCYASHLLCAQEVVSRNLPYAIVLEDDVTLAYDFLDAAISAATDAPVGWDFIHLSSDFKRAVVHVVPLGLGRQLVRHTRLPVNTGAYLISHAGARKWLKPRWRRWQADMDFRYAWVNDLDIYGVYPAPARLANGFASDVAAGAATHTPPGLASSAYGVWWLARKVGIRNFMRARFARNRCVGGKRAVAVLGNRVAERT